MSKVIIGIVAKHNGEIKKRPDTYIRDEVKQAIFDNGGIAIGILSPNEKVQMAGDDWLIYDKFLDKENIIKQIELCDGIILQGGNTNESYEPFIARYCYENNIPCLGICAGQNSVARALNGTIGKVKNPEKHDSSFDNYVHPIFVNKNSKFYSAFYFYQLNIDSCIFHLIVSCIYLQTFLMTDLLLVVNLILVHSPFYLLKLIFHFLFLFFLLNN